MTHFLQRPLAILTLCTALLGVTGVFAQTTIEVGTGALLNDFFSPPSPYANIEGGSRNQFLFLASELQAAGMSAGSISALGFNVFEVSTNTFTDFNIGIGATSVTELGLNWEVTPLTSATPQNYTDVVGWNMHMLSTPFEWDGSSNVVIESCYYNGPTTQNARVFQSATAFTSCVARASPNPTICNNPGGTHFPFQQRPNMRFEWLPSMVPPIAMPVASTTLSCSGTIVFTGHTTLIIDSWAWDFGDGVTASEETTSHTYTATGTYTVSLIVTNAFGADTATVEVSVDLDSPTPVAACEVPSTGNVEGFGIVDVTIEGIPHPSGDATLEGYQDNTCQSIDVVQGTPMELSITTGTISSHAVRAWVDWDNSGTFETSELVLSGVGPSALSATLVPSTAVLGLPLRLRTVAAYSLVTPSPTACDTVQFGQAEDYSVTVITNLDPPIASFTASPVYTCSGSVQFTDHTLNTPTAWTWDFGDGATSEEQDPLHTYTMDGIYTVSLTAINANGQDDSVIVDMITVDLGGQLVPASCTPGTGSYCCGYGVLGFVFAGINDSSEDGSVGYEDRSCGSSAMVEDGQSYAWSVVTETSTPHDVRIWIDLDNSGTFEPSELIVTALDQASPSGVVVIPNGSVFDTKVRLRVQADVIGQITGPCETPLFGQVEDHSVQVAQNMSVPVAAFSGSPRITCDGIVQFTDLSENVTTAWSWDFGDGGTSDEQNPEHTYTALGTYTVSLEASNDFGSGSTIRTNYIQVLAPTLCDTLNIDPQNGSINNGCTGILTDDGGSNGNYQPGTSGAFTIAPTDAETVALQFSQFQWGNNQSRTLAIYDGPDVNSPLIGRYNGNGLNQLPSNGLIASTGPSITLRQEQQGGGGPPFTSPGFVLSWNCSFTGVEERSLSTLFSLYPVPADEWVILEFAQDQQHERVISVFNVTGQLVHEQMVPTGATKVRLETSHYPKGAYAVQFGSAMGRSTRNLIIH